MKKLLRKQSKKTKGWKIEKIYKLEIRECLEGQPSKWKELEKERTEKTIDEIAADKNFPEFKISHQGSLQ